MDRGAAKPLEYSPLVNAEYSPKRGCSVWQAVCNYLACMFGGVGLLSFPYSIRLGGWIAVAAICVIPVVCCYTATLLMDCMYQTAELGKVRVRFTWEDIADACFPRCGAQIIVVTRTLHLMFVCSLYLLCSGALIHGLFSHEILDETWWRAICAAVILPSLFLPSWSALAWITSLGVILFSLACSTLLFVCVTRASDWDLNSITQQDNLEGVFIAINAILLGNNCHDMLPSIGDSMADKSKINFVVFFSYGVTTPFKLVFTVLAFLTFTSSTDEIVLKNLPPGWITVLASIPTVLNCLSTYVPTMYVVIATLDNLLPESHRERRSSVVEFAWFVAIRFVPLLVSLMVAEFVPHFAFLSALISSVLVAAYAYIFPSFFHLRLKYRELTYCQIFVDIIILLTGLASGIMGVLFSVKALLYRDLSSTSF